MYWWGMSYRGLVFGVVLDVFLFGYIVVGYVVSIIIFLLNCIDFMYDIVYFQFCCDMSELFIQFL